MSTCVNGVRPGSTVRLPARSACRGAGCFYAALFRFRFLFQGYRELSDGRKDEAEKKFWKDAKMIFWPAMLDLVASIFCFIGLLWNNASVWQMLRGSMIIWSALLSAGRGVVDTAVAIARGLHGPEAIFARTWSVGSMAFWVATMLGAYLLIYYTR